MDYHYSVGSWLKAGRPLDKPFLIVRERIMDTANVAEGTVQSILKSLCTLIIHNLAYYRDGTGGSSYHIEPVPPTFLHNTQSYDYKGFTFTICTRPSILGLSRVRISVGAIATILSGKEA